ncbi:hypothetical protein [Parendozoicomonas haliclonae]|nr:hypothetical protein [Parendozoicomonas haliclonae]
MPDHRNTREISRATLWFGEPWPAHPERNAIPDTRICGIKT